MSTNAENGKRAVAASDYTTAVHQYTLALNANPTSPLWLIQRSIAYQRLRQHDLALIDADAAVLAARTRQKRELIVDAQFRRAVALHGMKRFGDARLCLHWVRKMDEKYKMLGMWQAKVAADYDAAGGEGAEANQTTIKEIPDKVEEVSSKTVERSGKGKEKEIVKEDESKANAPETKLKTAESATPKEKIRHEFYQSTDKLTITVFAKGVPKDKGVVIIKEGSLEISFPVLGSGSTYDLTFDPLFARIDPVKSSFRITPHKIEILLQKSIPGNKWPSLEGTTAPPPSTPGNSAPTAVPPLTEKAPVYPTSSRNGPKNWDTIATQAIREGRPARKDGEDEEDVKDDDSDDGGDPTSAFFKTLYKGANDDTKKAMMKSYQESNGTALSTNWSEVKKGPVKTLPPDGVEAMPYPGTVMPSNKNVPEQ